MAIIENRSTEIGDIIRVRTDVPLIGLISLNMYMDDVQGEIFESDLPVIMTPDPTPMPNVRNEAPIELFPQGSRLSRAIDNIRVQGNNLYALAFGQDGSRDFKSIVRLDLDGRTWDTDYPDAPRELRALIATDNFLYGFYSVTDDRNRTVHFVAILDLNARSWQVIENTSFGGGIGTNAVVDKVCNNLIYYWYSTTGIGQRLASYNITNNTFLQVAAPPPSTRSVNPRSILGTSINCSGSVIYWQADIFDGVGEGNFNFYNILTDTFGRVTPAVGNNYHEFIYNETDDRIYFWRRTSRGSSEPRLSAFDTLTSTQLFLADGPAFGINSDIFAIGDRLYAFGANNLLYTYNITTNSWILSPPDVPPPPPPPEEPRDRFFTRTFRYSLDGGITFTDFAPLDEIAISNINVGQKDAFILEALFERSGTDTTGELVWNSMTLRGAFIELEFPIYNSTIFRNLFRVNDINVLNWALNVLEKLYQRGILPDYVDRNREGKDDTDFIHYWYSITHLFAILVYWARQFENIGSNQIILTEFLSNFDITLPFDLDLQDLGTIYADRLDEYRRRGTERITAFISDPNENVDGELLRLVNLEEGNFYLFSLTEASKFGWCIGLSSPTWTNTFGVSNLVLGYETSVFVENLSAYPLFGASNISIVNDTDVGGNVMAVTGYSGTSSQFGVLINSANPDQTKLIPIDPSIDYEISCKVKKLSNTILRLRFEAYAFGVSGVINMTPMDGANTNVNSFISDLTQPTVLIDDIYYNFNGILHSSTTNLNSNLNGNIRGYRGLRLPADATHISIGIYAEGDSSISDFYIYDIKIRPKDLPISQGLFGVKNIIVSYLENLGELTDEDARIFIQNKLIPYNSFLIPRWL